MSYKDIPLGTAEEFNVVVEIPKGSENKYEYDEDLDIIKLDWVFTGGFHFPFDYGFMPETRGGDGDNLDVFVINSHSLTLGTVAKCRAIGMVELLDRGVEDNKILAVPISDPAYKNCDGLDDLDFDYKTLFTDFFKELGIQKNKTMEIKGFRDKEFAIEIIKSANERFKTD